MILMKHRVLGSKVVQTDDSPVPVLDPELPRTRTGRIWTYVGDSEHPYIVYDYTPNRNRDGPDDFLQPFHGYLQADAYSGYDQLYQDGNREIVEVACWAHSRRKFFEAQCSDLVRTTVMLAYVRLLYDVEQEAREQKLRGEAHRAGAAPSPVETHLERHPRLPGTRTAAGVAEESGRTSHRLHVVELESIDSLCGGRRSGDR